MPGIFVQNIELALLVHILTSGNSIWLWQNFAWCRIFPGFGKNAGFWPEVDSGAILENMNR